MANIDSWRSANRPSNKSLPGLLEKLNIIPRTDKADKDDSALDTLSESSDAGGPAHSLPVPNARRTSGGTSPTPSATGTAHGSLAPGSPYGSLSKANPLSPGRRPSMVHHQPSTSQGEAASFLNRLTIVRAPSKGEHDREGRRGSSISGPSSPGLSTSSHGSLPHHPVGHSREHSGSFSSSPTARMSFAFSSFGQSPGNSLLDQRMAGAAQAADELSTSVSSHAGVGPGGRPSFSGQAGAGGGSGAGDRGDARDLTPREVVELARSTSRGQHGGGGGGHRRTSSTGSSHSPSSLGLSASGGGGRHRIAPQAPTFPDRPATLDDEYEPVEFHPMGDDMMLPFDDRPDEVKALIEAERNRGLFKLLKLALPAGPADAMTPGASEPAEWSYPELLRYLTETPREQVGDKAWVLAIRKAVETRSEPLWEKLKGLLGIDEDDDWGDDEVHLVGEQASGGNTSGIVLIEGLEEGGPADDGAADDGNGDAARRGSEPLDVGDHLVAGGMFSPEAGMAASLPGSSSLGELEAIGEAEEEEAPTPAPAPSGAVDLPTKQKSTDSARTLHAGLPTLITTAASPSSSFSATGAGSGGGLMDAAAAAASSTGDVSPFSHPLPAFNADSQLSSGMQTPLASAGPGAGSFSARSSSPLAGDLSASPGSRPARRSFVGVSIVSSSSADDYHHPHHRSSSSSSSAQPSAAISPSVSNHDLAHSPSFPLQPPIRRRTSVTHDDLQYGGNEASDPMTERGPGNPLFPSSFSNLSLKPWSRPSFSGRGSAAAKEIDGGSAGGSGGQPETPRAGGENNRDWAREMIGLKAGEKLSNSALTVGDSEYSRSSSGR